MTSPGGLLERDLVTPGDGVREARRLLDTRCDEGLACLLLLGVAVLG